jgi:hypothetical protein
MWRTMSDMGRADQRCQLALELTHHRFHLAVAHLHHTGFNTQSFKRTDQRTTNVPARRMTRPSNGNCACSSTTTGLSGRNRTSATDWS